MSIRSEPSVSATGRSFETNRAVFTMPKPKPKVQVMSNRVDRYSRRGFFMKSAVAVGTPVILSSPTLEAAIRLAPSNRIGIGFIGAARETAHICDDVRPDPTLKSSPCAIRG